MGIALLQFGQCSHMRYGQPSQQCIDLQPFIATFMCDEGLLLQYSRMGKVQNYLNKPYQVAETLTVAGSNQNDLT